MKKFLSIFLTVMCVAFLVSCNAKTDDSGEYNILTSFNPIYAMTLRITDGAENIKVENMAAPSTGCLHDYQLTTTDMAKLSKADIFVINGGGMESFMEKAMQASNNLNVLDSSKGIEMLLSEGGHDAGEYNSHIWLSIANAKKQAENIRDGLIAGNPENRGIYEKNTEDFLNELTELSGEYQTSLEGISGKVISFHEGIIYLLKDYGIEVTEIIETEPGVSPDPATLANIIEDVKISGIKVIFTEPQYPDSTAKVISRETGAKIYTLNPLVTGDMNRDSYITIMRENLQVIISALKQ